MSEPRSIEERVAEKEAQLEKVLKKADQYKAQIKQLEARKSEEERKKRTHKLIVCGAEIASIFGKPLEEDEVKQLSVFLKNQVETGAFLLSEDNKNETVTEAQQEPAVTESGNPLDDPDIKKLFGF